MNTNLTSPELHVAEVYDDVRPLLFSIAYRMLGRVAEAEDIVQEAFLRYQRALVEDATEIDSPQAYLSAITTRLAIDHLRSARVRKETYVGEWLPEPLLTDEHSPDAARHAENADSLSMAFLLLLETLSPVERAVFLLHDVFDYGYDEVASIVGKQEDNCRQLAVRARRHVDEHRPRFETSRERRERAGRALLRGSRGGRHGRSRRPARRRRRRLRRWRRHQPVVAQPDLRPRSRLRLMLGLGRHSRERAVTLRRTEVNGQPGAMFLDRSGLLMYIMTVDISDGLVQTIRSVINPDKLRHVGPLSEFRALAAPVQAATNTKTA